MADKSPELDASKVDSLLQVSPAEAEEDIDPLLATTAAEDDLVMDTVHSPGQGHSPGPGQSPALGHQGPPGPPGPPEQETPDTTATGTILSALTPAELQSTCSQLVESIFGQVVKCSEAGEHGLGEDTSCLSPTCSLGGVEPLGDLCSAVSHLVSDNVRFQRRTNFNCPQCKAVLCNTSHCRCGEVIKFPQILYRKAFSRCMLIFGKAHQLAKTRTANTARTAVTIHRWASYILQAHSVGYMGLLTDASTVHKQITCTCFGAPPVQEIKTVTGVNVTRAAKGRKAEVGKKLNLSPEVSSKLQKTIIDIFHFTN